LSGHAEPVSALEAGPNGWIQQVNFVVFGLVLLVFAVGLNRAIPSARLRTPCLRGPPATCHSPGGDVSMFRRHGGTAARVESPVDLTRAGPVREHIELQYLVVEMCCPTGDRYAARANSNRPSRKGAQRAGRGPIQQLWCHTPHIRRRVVSYTPVAIATTSSPAPTSPRATMSGVARDGAGTPAAAGGVAAAGVGVVWSERIGGPDASVSVGVGCSTSAPGSGG